MKAKEAELNTADETKKIELKKEISALKSAIGSTNDYTYTEARNGSKRAIILGSHMEATSKPDSKVMTDDEYEKYRTNERAASEKDGLSKFTGYFVEKNNVTRSNVLADDKLSERINTEISGDHDKLGKGGYFSTGDIPLGKDVVSYKVQVFAENEKRVGVNKQSPRLQYNLPILADFSVIQDTVEPSKEVAKRILTKLKEQGKITEDQEKKIKEEIDKSKKTSEVRSAMSGDVTVRYVDTNGNNLPITEEDAKKAGEKTDNGYLVRKDVLIGTDYDVHSKKVPSFNATNGKYYALRSVGGGLETSSDALNGSITKKNTVITFVYEERTVPPTGKGVVHFKKQVSETTTEALTGYDDITLEGNVGETFSPTDVDTRITALKNAGYEIVTNEFDTNSKTIDSTTDEDGQEPSQVYNVIVREKVETVTTPPTPDTPVDPNVPEGPKWPATGLAKSDLEKEVTRTITYVKKETADGPEIADAKPTKKQTAHFKRSATFNLVTKVVTPGEWTSTDKTLEAVPTEKLDGYVANVSSVEEVETNADSTNLDRKVVYTKLGSWVPKVPGVETPTPLPYPNHPTDPTKPGDPTDPNTPNVPVIPYVPGYTPKIGETPLEPVDPNNPENGYKVPPIPNSPGEDTTIEYSKDPQKAVVKVFNTTTGTEVELPEEKVELSGKTGEPIPADSVTSKIAELEKRGYTVENKEPLKGETFDKNKDPENGDPTQVFKLLVKERTVEVTEPKNPNDPIDPDKPEGPKWPATGLAKSDLEKEVTRTITYVKKETADGPEIENAKPTKKQTAHFKRSATYNLVTKVVTPGEWESTDKTLEAVPTEKLDGYVANVSSVEEVETNANSTNLDRKVVYTKLGSWVPKVPGVETPTPLPYPNHPTDPTKPGDPTDPNTPNVPVIPYVPGYTPKIGETPLQPKVPNDPTQGYIPPAVPTDPGTNTDITYVKDIEQKAIVNFVDENGNSVADSILQTGKSGDKFTKDALVKSTISELESKGYELEKSDYPKGGTGVFDNDSKVDQIFTVKVRKIEVLPPIPEIVERRGGNNTVEVAVPNKDADTLSIWYTKRNEPNNPKEEIITKKDENGMWKIEKAPEGVTINPNNGRVYIPSDKVQPKTQVDTQTKHKNKISKIVSVVPDIAYSAEFKGLTEWIDVEGNVLKPETKGILEKGRFENYVWLETHLIGNKVIHIFQGGTPTVDKPEYKITVWFDEKGNPIKPDQPGTHESGKIPGYRLITTTTKDGVTVHKFEKITPVDPNRPTPDKPTAVDPSRPTPENPNTLDPEKQKLIQD